MVLQRGELGTSGDKMFLTVMTGIQLSYTERETAPATKNHLTQTANSAEVEKPGFRRTERKCAQDLSSAFDSV